MDLLPWSNLNADVKITYTSKAFYRDNYYRLNYRIPLAFLLSTSHNLETLKTNYSIYNNRRNIDYNETKFETLKCCLMAKLTSSEKIRTRTEQQNFAMFFQTQQQAWDMANTDMKSQATNLIGVSVVRNQHEAELLSQGCVIVKTATEYGYRINLRSGFYSNQIERESLSNLLTSCADEFKIGKELLTTLIGPHKYIQGGYISVKDPRMANVISLIMPRLVSSVQQVVHIPNQ